MVLFKNFPSQEKTNMRRRERERRVVRGFPYSSMYTIEYEARKIPPFSSFSLAL
jgi:hypothetical protein